MVASRTLTQLAVAAALIALVVPSVVPSAAASDDSGIQWKVSDLFYGRPTVAPDGSVYVLMSKLNTDGTKSPVALRALDADGNKQWEAPVSGACYDPVVDANGTVYYTEISRNSYDSDLVAISAAGAPLWRANSSEMFPTKRFSSFSSPVVSADGNVLVTFDDRLELGQGESRLCSFEPDGSMSWITQIVHNQTHIAVGDKPGSLIYAVSIHGQVQGLFPNGTIAWTMDLSDRGLMVDSPAKVSHDGWLYLTIVP
jgi:outer membrane protein assembly factor BamB